MSTTISTILVVVWHTQFISKMLINTDRINIYVTSNEKVKIGDYILDNGSIVKLTNDAVEQGEKVIFTTDQNLIQEGIPAISVKELNPGIKRKPTLAELGISCEEALAIRHQFGAMAADWDDPEMDIYDDEELDNNWQHLIYICI